MEITDNENLTNALLKRALGFDTEETVVEYAGNEGGDFLPVKKKITKKSVPPDLAAIRLLLGGDDAGNLSDLSDEELLAEKDRLISLLKESDARKGE